MPIIPFEPYKQLDHLRNNLEKFLNEVPGGYGFLSEYNTARVDVYETENEVVVHCEIPGIENKENISIDIDDQLLTIQAIINRHQEVKEDHQIHRKERFAGRVQRSVALPVRVQAEGADAAYKNGILEIRMPKFKSDSRKRIDVQFH